MTLGQRIQELRKEKGLSQEQLGELLGVSRQAVSRWEMDSAIPEVDKLISLSRVFGVDLNDLLQVGRQNAASPSKVKTHPDSPRWSSIRLAAGALCAALLLSNLLLWVQVVHLKQQVQSMDQFQLDTLLPSAPQEFDPILLDLTYNLEVTPGDPTHLNLQVAFSLPDSFDMEDISVYLKLKNDTRPATDTGFIPMERDKNGVYCGSLDLDYSSDTPLDADVSIHFSGQAIQASHIKVYELVYYPSTNNSKVFLTYIP